LPVKLTCAVDQLIDRQDVAHHSTVIARSRPASATCPAKSAA
jgi:hypothetical protein